ncbi:hypothetical protein PJ985_18045 [Streptomyces sp. ACA25]|uniref:DUF6912 family protein n=1 Tax=Streptomyces sp. ACA25 TaxID=3022596 RepID=UPI0023070A64|nr:hypothetical protein [Streptomyces sp. ACA25]MDB1089465.1 hypothetical protein [Streptomyces sp. ACA25]
MRVYLPLTLTGLEELHRRGETGSAPLSACAVPPALRGQGGPGDEEELEYAALGLAAGMSLRLLVAEPEAVPRRVVLAADVAESDVAADSGRGPDAHAAGEVLVTRPVPLARVAAVHVDAPEAEPDITAAADALEAADRGDEDARFVVDRATDHELLWYAVQEIGELLR